MHVRKLVCGEARHLTDLNASPKILETLDENPWRVSNYCSEVCYYKL